MIEEPKTLTIQRPDRRPKAAQIAAFQGRATSFVVDAMYGQGSLGTAIAPVSAPLTKRVAGPALTVENPPSDILALVAATAFVGPGDVVVSTVGGHQGCAAAGDRVCGMLRNGGAAGFVTDGPMRDLPGLEAVDLPAWCTGLNPGSPFTTGPGKIGTPIHIAGQRVETGDMIVADQDGVVVVPFAQIDAVIARLATVATLEADLDAQVRDGLQTPEAIKALLESDAVTYLP